MVMQSKSATQGAWKVLGDKPMQIDLCGEFNFDTVPALYTELLPKIQRGLMTTVNLDKVTASNSAGLGLLLSLLSAARAKGHTLSLMNLPPAILAIAKVTGVSHLLTA